ncbi:hypothetical protein B4099_0208 [Heyndrickxia coagulans]|uniref:Uncharacterized protein n=1 Tax=Heyndrickxia coagulans TaxID=1398 RepID=A0A150KEF3_HEYCO|nr:hypothetical protein B4099_0208 [Heyndrickxia coagulans]
MLKLHFSQFVSSEAGFFAVPSVNPPEASIQKDEYKESILRHDEIPFFQSDFFHFLLVIKIFPVSKYSNS